FRARYPLVGNAPVKDGNDAVDARAQRRDVGLEPARRIHGASRHAGGRGGALIPVVAQDADAERSRLPYDPLLRGCLVMPGTDEMDTGTLKGSKCLENALASAIGQMIVGEIQDIDVGSLHAMRGLGRDAIGEVAFRAIGLVREWPFEIAAHDGGAL